MNQWEQEQQKGDVFLHKKMKGKKKKKKKSYKKKSWRQKNQKKSKTSNQSVWYQNLMEE